MSRRNQFVCLSGVAEQGDTMLYGKSQFKQVIKDRMEIIAPLVKGRKTLDLGVVDSRLRRAKTGERLIKKSSSLLYRRICEINPDALGVDIDKEGVNILQEQGFHAKTANVITMDLGEQFDTIIAGEIIEHLVNPGKFLCNVRKHLIQDGTLVITTPNPFYCGQVWRIWRYKRPRVHEEHTCWFDPITLSHLCCLSGLVPYEIYWIRSGKRQFLKTWPRLFRNYFSNSFMILAQRDRTKRGD